MAGFRDFGTASALSFALYAAMAGAPRGAVVLMWIAPLPGLVLAAMRPSAVGAWLAATALGLACVLGVPVAGSFAVTIGALTAVVATGVRHAWGIERAFTAALAIWVVGIGVLFYAAAGSVAAAAYVAREQVEVAFTLALEASVAAGADARLGDAFRGEQDTLVRTVVLLLPALVTVAGGLILCINLAAARRIAPVFHSFHLRYWKAPEPMIWVLIGTGFAMFAPWEPVSVVCANLFIVAVGCYFLQGLAIVAYYLERYRLPTSLRIGTYGLIALQQILAAVVLALGIFDLWGDFRRLQAGAADAQAGFDGE
jgi:hypothetical protein